MLIECGGNRRSPEWQHSLVIHNDDVAGVWSIDILWGARDVSGPMPLTRNSVSARLDDDVEEVMLYALFRKAQHRKNKKRR